MKHGAVAGEAARNAAGTVSGFIQRVEMPCALSVLLNQTNLHQMRAN